MTDDSLERLYTDLRALQDTSENALPPVGQWHPDLSGDIDIRIARDGTWYHEGSPIKRLSLVNLFSSILRKEDDQFYLVTPVEKWRIVVEDAPLHVIALEVQRREGHQALLFSTATDDRVVASAANPLHVTTDPQSGEPSPYLVVRDGLEALLSRPVFYELADLAETRSAGASTVYGVVSMGEFFPLS